MPRNYVRKTDYKAPDPEIVLDMLKAVKIDKKAVYAVSKNYGIPKDNLYRIVNAFENKVGTDVEITEELLKEYVENRNPNPMGLNTVSSPYFLIVL